MAARLLNHKRSAPFSDFNENPRPPIFDFISVFLLFYV